MEESRASAPSQSNESAAFSFKPTQADLTMRIYRAPARRAIHMAGYKFKCKDIGMKCDFEVKGASSKDEVMQITSVHAKAAHNIQNVTPDLAQKVSSAIKG